MREPFIVNLDFIGEYLSSETKPGAESSMVEWVDIQDALSRVQRQAMYQRLKAMIEFSGRVTYGAYFVDPNRGDLNFQELEWKKTNRKRCAAMESVANCVSNHENCHLTILPFGYIIMNT